MKTYKKPFFHIQIPNFLSVSDYDKLLKIYSKTQLKQKSSDLFHFYQSNELAAQKSLKFFMNDLSQEFKKLCTEQQFKDSFYTIFASYYFKDDYLLCHDDIIQDRKYAFSYYLDDYKDGGELVLFNSEADGIVKKIKVRKNTLVIFQVCDVSYHQVAHCRKNGRKAVTGWFNVKGQGSKRIPKQIDTFKPNKVDDALVFPLDKSHIQEEYFQMMDVQYQFNIIKQKVIGPFYSRKLHRIEINPVVTFEVPGYSLISSDFFKVGDGDYLLLNDPLNTMEGEDIIDIFVTKVPERLQQKQAEKIDEEDDDEDGSNMLIKIVEEDGSMSGIPAIDDSLFVVKRGKKQYYIERNKQQFTYAHFIFKANPVAVKNNKKAADLKKQKSLNKKAPKNNKKQTKQASKPVLNVVKDKKQLPKSKLSKKINKAPKKIKKQTAKKSKRTSKK